MKAAVLTFLLVFFLSSIRAQNGTTFLRIYNVEGKKIAKGEILETTDTTIVLTNGTKYKAIPATQIEVIKSKRTTAHRVGVTTLKVIGCAVLFAGVIYSLTLPKTNYYGTDNLTSTKNKAKPDKKKHYSKPMKKYKVNNDADTWQHERENLNKLL